jgi:hypothetical protein
MGGATHRAAWPVEEHRRRPAAITLAMGVLAFAAVCSAPACGPYQVAPPGPDAAGDYGFAEHLREAIALNTARQPLYSAATEGRSVALSALLISGEESLLPLAMDFDRRARAFHLRGIPIVADDFVSMFGVPAHDAPIPRRGALTDEARGALAAALEPMRTVDPADFREVCDVAYQALLDLEAIEHTYDVHFAMTKHLLESPAIAALHAIEYAALSGGQTIELSRDLIASQLELPMEQDLGLIVDSLANQYHRVGIGIIVNDVPHIPFVEEYESATGR